MINESRSLAAPAAPDAPDGTPPHGQPRASSGGASEGILASLVRKARERPDLIVPGLIAYLSGFWHKLKFKLLLKDVRIGRGFRVYGRLRISGPGSVQIGDNCFILGQTLRPVSLLTWRPQARIVIGNNVGLNGTVINAYESVEIDDLCNIADAYIIDSSAHHLSADRRFLPTETVPRSPVRLEHNVWVSLGVVILKGVTIGANSVIGACSLIRRDVLPNTFVAGNPPRELRSIPERFEDTQAPGGVGQ